MAFMLAKGMLKRVWVPTKEQCYHRHVARRRRQLIGDRVRVQNRIKADLRFYGIPLEGSRGKWSRVYVENLRRIQFGDPWMQESFDRLLEEYDFLSKHIKAQTDLLRKLSQTELYRERVEILQSAPGMGLVSAMELLLELQDITRFRRADRLAAYVGLTPSQHSSGEKTRMGRITRAGKGTLRKVLVEASWVLVRTDEAMRQKYETIKARSGSKRAIVAIARIFLLRIRRMLLDGRPYAMGLVG